MKVQINGIWVEGNINEVAELLGVVSNNTPTLPNGVNYSNEGIESSTPTPAQPTKKQSDVKTKYQLVEDTLNGKKVYRIKCGIFKKAVSARKVANAYIKNLEGILTGEFSFTDDNGKDHSFAGWYFKTKKAAEAALKTLPEKISGSEIEAEYNKYLAYKASH